MASDPENREPGEVKIDLAKTQVFPPEAAPAVQVPEVVEFLCVEVVGGPMDGLRGQVETTTFAIGRNAANDLALVMDPMASSFHARIEREGNHYWLVDLGSRNGVYLGDQRLEKRALIGAGTTFLVGQTQLEFMPH